jgi:uncharacterized membrane protein YraQ (UPF0718 family)
MILLVAGVGTNLSTLGPVARVMGLRTAVVYAASVVALSGLLGYLLNRLLWDQESMRDLLGAGKAALD